MSGPSAERIVLRRRLRRSLETIARSSRAPHARVVRARIALLAADGHRNAEVAEGRKPKADPMAKRNPGIPGPKHLSQTVRFVTTCRPN